MNDKNNKTIIGTSVELATKYTNETFTKKSKGNSVPDIRDIIGKIEKEKRKQE
ncbi:MAG: hypothetical protein K0S41_3687 [Anaerocolumna sp.]|jgi:hypothetical protein|nr:hypothetical protein [Anaerocolumna sp.]